MAARKSPLLLSILVLALSCCITFLLAAYVVPKEYNRPILLEPINEPLVLPEGFISGPADAPYTMIEISAFDCKFSRKNQATIQQLRDTYDGALRYAFVPFPRWNNFIRKLPVFAYLAAKNQGKATAMKRALFESEMGPRGKCKDQMTSNVMAGMFKSAEIAGLDLDRFEEDLYSQELIALADTLAVRARSCGAKATPTLFVNNYIVGGAMEFTALKRVLHRLDKAK